MFVARIKFEVQHTTSYEVGKIYSLFEEENIKCVYRYNEDNSFEFVLGNFLNQNDAFERGKQLYVSILYLLNADMCPFDLKVIDFEEVKSHLTRNEDLVEPDKFYFSNHNFFNNCNGLEVFEIDKDFFNEYDNDLKFQQPLCSNLEFFTNHEYHFESIKDLKIEFGHNCLKILRLYELYRYTEDLSIKALIVSIIFETMANMELKKLLDKCEQSNVFDEKEKRFFNEFINFEKEGSVLKKCNLLIQKYSNSYEKDKKIFKKCYELRSQVTHGEPILDERKLFKTIHDSFILSLKIFKCKFSL